MQRIHRSRVRATSIGFLAALLTLGGTASSVSAAQGRPAFVDGAISARAASGKLTIPRPSGTSPGDVMVAGVAEHEVGTIDAPAGWRLIRHDKVDRDIWLWLYYRVAGRSEPSSYVWKVGDKAANGAILTYRGVDRATPVVASAGKADRGNTSTIQAPSMNVGPDRVMLVMFATVEGPTPNPISPPSGFTERTERNVHPSTESSDKLFSGGTTGVKRARPKVGKVGNVGAIVALRPA